MAIAISMIITRIPAAALRHLTAPGAKGVAKDDFQRIKASPRATLESLVNYRKIVASSWLMGFHYFLPDSTL